MIRKRLSPKSAQLMVYLLARNSWIEADLIDQLFNSSEKWLARVLLLLARFGKERDNSTRDAADQWLPRFRSRRWSSS